MHPGVTTVVVFIRPIVVTYVVHTSLVLICVAPFHAFLFRIILGPTIIAGLSI